MGSCKSKKDRKYGNKNSKIRKPAKKKVQPWERTQAYWDHLNHMAALSTPTLNILG